MKTKCIILGALILIITFSLGVSAWAGERWDNLSTSAKSTFGDIVGTVSPGTADYIKTTNFGVGQRVGSALSALKGVEQSAALGAGAFKAGLASIPSGVKTSFISGGSSFQEGLRSISGQLNNLSNAVGSYTRLWGTKSPQETDFERVKRELPYGAYIYSKMEVRKESTKSSEPNLFSSRQTADIFQNVSTLTSALKQIGTNISEVVAIRGDVYNSNGSLAEKNALIVGRGQNGSFSNNNLLGKTIDVKSIESQRSY